MMQFHLEILEEVQLAGLAVVVVLLFREESEIHKSSFVVNQHRCRSLVALQDTFNCTYFIRIDVTH